MSNNELGMFNSIDVGSSALSAQRVRMNTIANNLANVNTTRTPTGGPFKRQEVVFESILNEAMGTGSDKVNGVKVAEIRNDESSPIMVYKPDHPDADANGYVAFPNINAVQEMVDMIEASKTYEANVTSIMTAKEIVNAALGISRQ